MSNFVKYFLGNNGSGENKSQKSDDKNKSTKVETFPNPDVMSLPPLIQYNIDYSPDFKWGN